MGDRGRGARVRRSNRIKGADGFARSPVWWRKMPVVISISVVTFRFCFLFFFVKAELPFSVN